MFNIDAKGKECPLPVIMAKKEIDNKNLPLAVMVDNEIAVKNLQKLVASKNLQCDVTQDNDIYTVTISADGEIPEVVDVQLDITCSIPTDNSEWILFINNETLGATNLVLGKKLIELFLYTLIEMESKPTHILFMNGGVKIPTTYDQGIEHLKALSDLGVNILSCGACLNFYELTDSLQVGQISNMYELAELLTSNKKVLTI